MTSPHHIVRNAARCDTCNQVVESKHRHDFVECECGALAVDGGREYTRRVYKPDSTWTELAEYADYEDVADSIMKRHLWEGFGI